MPHVLKYSFICLRIFAQQPVWVRRPSISLQEILVHVYIYIYYLQFLEVNHYKTKNKRTVKWNAFLPFFSYDDTSYTVGSTEKAQTTIPTKPVAKQRQISQTYSHFFHACLPQICWCLFFFFFWSWSWIKVYLWCKQASTKLSLLLTLLHLIRVRHHLQNKLFLTARVVFTSSSTAEHQSCWYLCTRQMYAPGGLPHVFFVPSPLLFLWPQPSALTYVLTVHSATLHW